jgi:hypothetical protein
VFRRPSGANPAGLRRFMIRQRICWGCIRRTRRRRRTRKTQAESSNTARQHLALTKDGPEGLAGLAPNSTNWKGAAVLTPLPLLDLESRAAISISTDPSLRSNFHDRNLEPNGGCNRQVAHPRNRPNAPVVGAKLGRNLGAKLWGEPLRWHNFFGHSSRFVIAFLHLLAG